MKELRKKKGLAKIANWIREVNYVSSRYLDNPIFFGNNVPFQWTSISGLSHQLKVQ